MSNTVFSNTIFHGLPSRDQFDGKKLSILVTGSNGITGSEVVNLLAKSPKRWEKIYALSRKPPASTDKHVVPIAVDFLNGSPAEIASILQEHNVKAYVHLTTFSGKS